MNKMWCFSCLTWIGETYLDDGSHQLTFLVRRDLEKSGLMVASKSDTGGIVYSLFI